MSSEFGTHLAEENESRPQRFQSRKRPTFVLLLRTAENLLKERRKITNLFGPRGTSQITTTICEEKSYAYVP